MRLRPLAAPFLLRFQARMGTAIQQSGLSDDITRLTGGLSADIARLTSQIEAVAHAISHMQRSVERLETRGEIASDRFEALRLGIPDLRVTTRRIEEAIAHEAQRLTLVQEAMCRVELPLVTRVEEIGRMTAQLVERDRVPAMAAQVEEIQRLTAQLVERDRAPAMAAQVEEIQRLTSELVNRNTDLPLAAAVAGIERMTAKLVNRNAIPLPEGDFAVRSPHGYVIVPGFDIGLVVYLAEGDGHEIGTVAVLVSLLDAGDTAVDIGAHVGMMAMPMARRIGASGLLYAFEPSPETAARLRRTLAFNGLDGQVRVVEQAVGDQPGQALLHFGSNTSTNSLLPAPGTAGGAGVTVEVVRLDAAIPAGLPVAVVKMDVEGAELGVLAGMPRLLAENPDLIVVAEYDNAHLRRSSQTAQAWLGAFAVAGLDTALAIGDRDGICHRVTAQDLAALDGTVNLVLARGAAPRLARLRMG
ncbi:FkbM family methyltransferase [Humitalea rosea]|nr:FkbM family methyltransferase [Humitalea rosea]